MQHSGAGALRCAGVCAFFFKRALLLEALDARDAGTRAHPSTDDPLEAFYKSSVVVAQQMKMCCWGCILIGSLRPCGGVCVWGIVHIPKKAVIDLHGEDGGKKSAGGEGTRRQQTVVIRFDLLCLPHQDVKERTIIKQHENKGVRVPYGDQQMSLICVGWRGGRGLFCTFKSPRRPSPYPLPAPRRRPRRRRRRRPPPPPSCGAP